MCSTFKLLLAADVLQRVDSGTLKLEDQIHYQAADLLPNSPVTSQEAGNGAMSIRELACAAVQVSDNAAANLLLRQLGGPAALTAFLRSIGDATTRLDREETELNSNLHDDPRDTTTPAAMTATVARLFANDILSASSRNQLGVWLQGSTTGGKRLRARLPASWNAGDKTGTGANNAVNDVLIAWPPGRAPVIAAVLLSDSSATLDLLEAAHADIGALLVEHVA
jgi:beta-lactamase class A